MKINKKLDNLLRKKSYQKIPLEIYQSGHIVFELVLNNIGAKFLLDTGASGTILTVESIEKFNLQLEETSESGTGAGTKNIAMQNSVNNSLIFKEKEIKHIDIFVMDLQHVNNSFIELGHPSIDGVLGADILTKYDCVIDYKGMNLYIAK
jgi:predicted aspartyl protease